MNPQPIWENSVEFVLDRQWMTDNESAAVLKHIQDRRKDPASGLQLNITLQSRIYPVGRRVSQIGTASIVPQPFPEALVLLW